MKTATLHSRTIVRFVALCIVSLLASSAMAQSVADIWLKKTTSLLQKKGVEIVFRINEDGFRIGGKLLMYDNSYFFDTDDMKIWFDGTTQWTLQMDSEYNELYISKPAMEDQQSINPYMLLKNYNERFIATDGGEKTINGELLHKVTLTAKDEQQELDGLHVYLRDNGELAAMTLLFSDERTIKIGVRSMRCGLTFPKSTFTYSSTQYPADEVIDMR